MNDVDIAGYCYYYYWEEEEDNTSPLSHLLHIDVAVAVAVAVAAHGCYPSLLCYISFFLFSKMILYRKELL
jgi:hypothetical protein